MDITFSKAKLYDNLDDMPIKIYAKINLTGDIKHLCYEGNASDHELLNAWESVQKEFYERFGMDDKVKDIMRTRIAYIRYMIAYYVNNDKFSKTLASIEKAKMDMVESEKGKIKTDFMDMVVNISLAVQMKLDYGSLTVSEFFFYLKKAEEIGKQYAKINKK